MSNLILETKNLSKKFGKQLIVDSVSLKIKRNSIYGILGQNGAGKTTILKMIMGLLKPTGGEIIFEGETWRYEHLEKISKERIYEVLELVDLSDTGGKTAAHFSMGMKQRLGIAIALLGKPQLLILDEPTNGLDPIGIQKLRNLITTFSKNGMTVILSSHILSEVAQVVDDIGIIDKGKLLFQGTPSSKESLEEFYLDFVNGDRIRCR